VPASLPEDLLALLRQPSPCFISTSMPDGSPQLTQTWVDTDGSHILINTVDGFQKVKNIEQLAQRYLGKPYPWYGGRDQTRLVLTIAPHKVHSVG
jgi:hypothetical protein